MLSFERRIVVPLSALALTSFLQCGSTGTEPANGPGQLPSPSASTTPVPGAPTQTDDDAGQAQGQTPSGCRAIDRKAFADCLDTAPPDACAAKTASEGAACDVDEDGLDDALEDAMIWAYAPVFAYNRGDGGHTAGDNESAWPTNAAQYVAHSKLYWRMDNDGSTSKLVDAAPKLDTLALATFEVDGQKRHASSPVLGEGPNFWLCLNKSGDDYESGALVGSSDESRKLADGVDVFAVAHPTVKGYAGDYIVISYMLYYAYNRFTLDNHEGDWEGGAVFVNRKTGKVAALYTDRHDTADGFKLPSLEGDGAVEIRNPRFDDPVYNVCSDTHSGPSSGIRFWDFDGPRRHPVIYVAAGGHASYAYPGATKITGAGCVERTIIRDVHNGDGPRFVPSEDAYALGWRAPETEMLPVEHKVRFRNLGEPGHLREAWSAFAGQWGCTYESIPKSYPGPWDNQRLCRHWLTAAWGATMPFVLPAKTSCTDG